MIERNLYSFSSFWGSELIQFVDMCSEVGLGTI